MRIAIKSNAKHGTSAYSIQAGQLDDQLKAAGHDTAIFADFGVKGGMLTIGGTPHYPSGRLEYSADVLPGHVAHFAPDLLITLHDLMAIDPGLVRGFRDHGISVWHWMPVDCSPLSVLDRTILQMGGGQPIAMSRFGEAQLTEPQFGGFSDVWYVPHSIDTGLFRPYPAEARRALRAQYGIDGKFAVAVNAMNKSTTRKGFYEAYKGFAGFHAEHPDSALLVHAADDGGGLDLAEAARVAGIPDGAIINPFGDAATQAYAITTGMVSAGNMALWYALADVGLMASWGEGFGIPAIEFQGCGVPIVATNCTALTEVTPPGTSWRVPGQEVLNPDHKREWRIPSIPGITRALKSAYLAWKGPAYGARRKRAREFALRYDRDLVWKQYWEPLVSAEARRREDERAEGD